MGTHHKGPATEVGALDCYIKLIRAAESLLAGVSRHLAKFHLTTTQFGTLEALHHLGPLSTGQIAGKLLKSGGNLTMVLDNLEKRGLVARKRSDEDRRSVMILLTPAGCQFIESLFPEVARLIAGQMQSLSPEEQKELGALCRRLGRAANEKREPSKRSVRPSTE
ncbi:MAG: MarR family transcriptional regulator [bacterium]